MVALAGIFDQREYQLVCAFWTDGTHHRQAQKDYVTRVIDQTVDLNDFAVATMSGRYYAMDRDQNWDRIERAYRALAEAVGQTSANALDAIDQGYADGITDEFILPTVIGGYDGMETGDAILMFNFRADRAREILASLVDPGFDEFSRRLPPLSCRWIESNTQPI